MGTYIVDSGDAVPYAPTFVLKPDRNAYLDYLSRHVATARESGAAVGVSVVSIDINHTVDFLRAAEEAGADYTSLCLHSVMSMFVSAGMSSALLWRENWPRLREYLALCLQALSRPFIAKIGFSRLPDVEQAAGEIVAAGVRLIHANVGQVTTAEGRDRIRRLKAHGGFVVAGGGIASADDAVSAIEAGADAVAVGTAAMDDPTLCGKLQAALHDHRSS
jgi:dihydroorotate dehydrogenase